MEIEEEDQAILKALGQFQKGASIKKIIEASGWVSSRRTLQRRLDSLVEEGVLKRTGNYNSVRYHLATITVKEEAQLIAPGMTVPLTEPAKEILAAVSLPVQQRKPIGYKADFLRSYRPNIDSYLSTEEKAKLAETGKTLDKDLPAGTYAKEILNRLLIDLSWNSSRLEGNTYSLLDTERLIHQGLADSNKPGTETQMILNHKEAIEFLVEAADDIGFNRYTILNLHGLLSNNLLPNPASSGRLRSHAVGIGQSVYTPPGIPQQIEEMFEMVLQKADEIIDPFEQSFFIMVQLPYLQPFEDVNKRVSRLAANIPLNRHNLSPLSFVDVPHDIYTKGLLGVYELNRVDLLKDLYIWAYGRSALRYASVRETLGDPDLFKMRYRDAIRATVAEIVSGALPYPDAKIRIEAQSLQIPEGDRAKFVEYVEIELMSLHEGNIARYWVRPVEFRRWKEAWAK